MMDDSSSGGEMQVEDEVFVTGGTLTTADVKSRIRTVLQKDAVVWHKKNGKASVSTVASKVFNGSTDHKLVKQDWELTYKAKIKRLIRWIVQHHGLAAPKAPDDAEDEDEGEAEEPEDDMPKA